MKALAIAAVLIALGSACHAQNPAAFVLQDGDGPTAFNRDAWLSAADQEGDKVLGAFLFDDPAAFDKAAEAARAAGMEENTVILATTSVTARTSTEFAPMKAEMDQMMHAQAADFGWRTAFELPMCVLYERDRLATERAPFAVLGVMTEPSAQQICYRMAIVYFTSRQDADGTRTPPVYVDARTVAMQEMMPPIAVRSAYLAHKDKRDAEGRYLRRDSQVYAPNEEIFLRAYLEHVARALPGTMDMRFEIDLHMEVRDDTGNALGRVKLHTYAAPSTLLYPVDRTQFWNNITAGVSLADPGRYELAFIFTDRIRDGAPSDEITFEIRIEEGETGGPGDGTGEAAPPAPN